MSQQMGAWKYRTQSFKSITCFGRASHINGALAVMADEGFFTEEADESLNTLLRLAEATVGSMEVPLPTKANSTKRLPWLIRSTSIFIVARRSYIYI